MAGLKNKSTESSSLPCRSDGRATLQQDDALDAEHRVDECEVKVVGG